MQEEFVLSNGSTITANNFLNRQELTYQWTAATAIANANAAGININPLVSTNYFVKVTDVENCSSRDDNPV